MIYNEADLMFSIQIESESIENGGFISAELMKNEVQKCSN